MAYINGVLDSLLAFLPDEFRPIFRLLEGEINDMVLRLDELQKENKELRSFDGPYEYNFSAIPTENKKIKAIKLIRNYIPLGLEEAKEACEGIPCRVSLDVRQYYTIYNILEESDAVESFCFDRVQQ